MSTILKDTNTRSLREVVKRGSGTLHCLTFRSGTEVFAIPLDRIVEAQDRVSVPRVPDLPSGTMGMIGVGGRTIPVIDGAEFLGVATSEPNPSILMFGAVPDSSHASSSASPVVALAVDELLSSVEFDVALIQRVIAFEDRGGEFAGVIVRDGQLVTLLDSDPFVRANSAGYLDSSE